MIVTWDYVCGYFDGEGTAGFNKRGPNTPKRSARLTWYNTHRESLDAIHQFLGCGILDTKRKIPNRLQQYALRVNRVDDLRRVIPEMIPRCIIKRPALEDVLASLEGVKANPNYGKIASIGADEVHRLYWTEGMSAFEIAERIGVSGSAVTNFMIRSAIPQRNKSEANRAAAERGRFKNKLIPSDIRRMYWDEGMSIVDIGRAFGVKHYLINQTMRNHGIQRRTHAESLALREAKRVRKP